MPLFRQATTSLRFAARTGASSSTPASSMLLSRAAPTQTKQTLSLFHTSAARLLSADARKKIDEAVRSTPLVVFMKGDPGMPMCGFSRAVCQIMEANGVDPKKMKTYNVLDDQDLREGIKEYSSWPTIPQVYVEGEFLGGCDIMLSMHQSGELEEALQKADVLLPMPPPGSEMSEEHP